MFENIIKNVHNRHPLIHCITNYVSINDCANIVLACGGAPIKAEDINEVSQITSICQGLDINIGMLNDNKLSSMLKAGATANELGIPVYLTLLVLVHQITELKLSKILCPMYSLVL